MVIDLDAKTKYTIRYTKDFKKDYKKLKKQNKDFEKLKYIIKTMTEYELV